MTPDYPFWAFVATGFLGLLCGPIIFPLIIGIFAFRKYSEDGISKLISLFVIKPVLTHPLWFVIIYSLFLNDISKAVIPVLIEAGLTIGIIVVFRHLFTLINWYLWLIVLVDISRWLITFIAFYPAENTSVWSMQWLLSCVGFVYPSFLAVLALAIMIGRNKILPSSINKFSA